MVDEILDYLFSKEGVFSKSYIISAVALLISSVMPEMYRYNTVLAKWLAFTNPDVTIINKIIIILSISSLFFALATGVRICGHVINMILDNLEARTYLRTKIKYIKN